MDVEMTVTCGLGEAALGQWENCTLNKYND